MSSRSFIVGRLESKFPSTVRFFPSHCTFDFHNSQDKKQILMDMTYADLSALKLKADALVFRPVNPLAHYGDNYQPMNRRHIVSIGFSSADDKEAFQREVLPVMRRLCRP